MAQRENSQRAAPQQQDSSTPELERSVQEIMELGNQASHLLRNPVYNVAYNQRLQEYFARWLNSEPKEEKLRESLFHEARAMVVLTEDLAGMVNAAEELLAREQEQNSPEGRRREYEDNQGFGTNFGVQ